MAKAKNSSAKKKTSSRIRTAKKPVRDFSSKESIDIIKSIFTPSVDIDEINQLNKNKEKRKAMDEKNKILDDMIKMDLIDENITHEFRKERLERLEDAEKASIAYREEITDDRV